MKDYMNNTSLDISNFTSDDYTYINNSSDYFYVESCINSPYYVVTYTVVCIGLPLTLVAIYALYSLVQKDHVTPIYVINLLISDLIQLCYMITQVARPRDRILYEVFDFLYFCGLTSSVGFMVCVAMERYLVVAWPLWYHFRRTIKSSVVVCVVVWGLSLLLFFVNFLVIATTFFGVLLLLPLPLFIFFLGGTLRALSASQSVSSDEKRRIVGCLVLVMLIYTLLFLPTIIVLLAHRSIDNLCVVSVMLLRFSPLADFGLYVFMRKGAIDKLLASMCCCRMDSEEISSSAA